MRRRTESVTDVLIIFAYFVHNIINERQTQRAGMLRCH